MTDTLTTIEALVKENDALRAKLREQPTGAPTVYEILGPEAFERLVELHPSFRESGTPIAQSDTAAEVLWSAIRYIGRLQKQHEGAQHRLTEAAADFGDLKAKHDRATNALAAYAMRAVEEGEV